MYDMYMYREYRHILTPCISLASGGFTIHPCLEECQQPTNHDYRDQYPRERQAASHKHS